MSKYSWHPEHPPSPPDKAIASRIAAIGPIGKCLETALDELVEEDRREAETTSAVSADDATAAAADTSHKPNDKATSINRISMDESFAKSILQSYADSVASTSYDHRTKYSASSTNRGASGTHHAASSKTAPAALLTGEIQHYNRIGGQWRIVVKNATLLPRRVINSVGKTGRKRVMLDWEGPENSDDDASKDSADEIQKKKKKKGDDEKAYKLDGTVQILAYNDDT